MFSIHRSVSRLSITISDFSLHDLPQATDFHDFFKTQVRSAAARKAALEEVGAQRGLRQKREDTRHATGELEVVRRAWNRYLSMKERWEALAPLVFAPPSRNKKATSARGLSAEEEETRLEARRALQDICQGCSEIVDLGREDGSGASGAHVEERALQLVDASSCSTGGVLSRRDPLLLDLADELRSLSAKKLVDFGGALALADRGPVVRGKLQGGEQLALSPSTEKVADETTTTSSITTMTRESPIVPAQGTSTAPTPAPPSKGQPCPDCGDIVPKQSMKRHKEKKCRRRLVRCPNAGCCAHKKLVPAEELAEHVESHCAGRQKSCPDCHDLVRAAEFERHLNDLCPVRQVCCDHAALGCTWQGAFLDRAEHEVVCPFIVTQCEWCFEALPQHKMAAHVCETVDAVAEGCGCCSHSWADLLKQEIPPAILVEEGWKSCLCPRPTMCVVCACSWRGEKEQVGCAFCRAPYDGVSAFALHLLELGPSATRGPPPSKDLPSAQEDSPGDDPLHKLLRQRRSELPDRRAAPLGSTHWVSPLELRFTHDSVSSKFKDFSSARLQIHLENQSILDSIAEVLSRRTQVGGGSSTAHNILLPKTLDCLDVCWDPRDEARRTSDGSEGRMAGGGGSSSSKLLFLAGTGNRRLTMWRLLAIFLPENFRRIKVRLVDGRNPRVRFDQACTTWCEGRWIQVRGVPRGLGGGYHKKEDIFVGVSKEGDADWVAGSSEKDPGVRWEEAVDLIKQAVRKPGM